MYSKINGGQTDRKTKKQLKWQHSMKCDVECGQRQCSGGDRQITTELETKTVQWRRQKDHNRTRDKDSVVSETDRSQQN